MNLDISTEKLFAKSVQGGFQLRVFPQSMAKVKNFGKDCADTIGTGPYVITEWVPNDHYTLVYNEKYWGKKPSVTKVIVSIVPDASTQNLLYQKGELDILDLESLDSTIVQSTYKTTYADKLVVAPRVGLTYLAMICRPRLLIADEPTTALDVTVEAQILRLLRALTEKQGTSVLLISHDLGVVAQLCDSVNVMYAGQIVEQAPVCALFDRPAHPYTRGLLGAVQSLRAGDAVLDTIPGGVPDFLRLPPGCRFAPRCGQACPGCAEVRPPLRELMPGHFARCVETGGGV